MLSFSGGNRIATVQPALQQRAQIQPSFETQVTGNPAAARMPGIGTLYTVSVSSTGFYASNSVKSKKLKTIYQGDIVNVMKLSNGWAKAYHHGILGYVKSSTIRRKGA